MLHIGCRIKSFVGRSYVMSPARDDLCSAAADWDRNGLCIDMDLVGSDTKETFTSDNGGRTIQGLKSFSICDCFIHVHTFRLQDMPRSLDNSQRSQLIEK